MTLLVRSARLGRYHGADGLNVTRKTGTTLGLVFAPSWSILAPMLARRRAERGADPDEAAEAFAWAEYVEAFTSEMRISYVKWRPAWNELLARPRVTLLCYCRDPLQCHRAVLRRVILPKLGAYDAGEVDDE